MYPQYSNHGPGPQNSWQTKRAAFGQAPKVPVATYTFDPSVEGIASVTTFGAADRVEVAPLETGGTEIRINGNIYRLEGLHEIRVYTGGDNRDQIIVHDGLGNLAVNVDRTNHSSTLDVEKLDPRVGHYWQTGELPADFNSLLARM